MKALPTLLLFVIVASCSYAQLSATQNPSRIPSNAPTPAPTTCVDLSSWTDSAGDSCEWYEADPLSRCNAFGKDYKNKGYTAQSACCACNGGFIQTNRTMPSFQPTSRPTFAPSNTVICVDDNTWRDEDGNNCNDYERDLDDDEYFLAGETRCSLDQDRNGDASTYCCACGGGYKEPFVPTFSPSFTSSPSTTDVKMLNPSVGNANNSTCMDIAGWVDIFGEGCDYYEIPFDIGTEDENVTKCEKYGTSGIRNGYTASTACCVCNGGVDVRNRLFKEETNPKARPTKPTLGIIGEYCIDTPKWDPTDTTDIVTSCESYWFKQKDGFVTCEQYGHIKTFDGITGNDACCICGGGYNGTLIGNTYRITFSEDSDDNVVLYTNVSTGDRDGTIIRFLHEVSNATGFGMYYQNLSEAALERYPTDTYLACEYDLTLGNTDICIGPFWSETDDNPFATSGLYVDDFYLVVPKPDNSLLRRLLLPVMPLTANAWVGIILTSIYMVLVLAFITGEYSKTMSFSSFCRSSASVCFYCIRSCALGDVDNQRNDPTGPERVIYASYAVFGLIFLTAYTAVSAAFLVVGLQGANSLNDIVDSGKTICVQQRAYNSLISEQPQTASLAIGKVGYSTFNLIDEMINNSDSCGSVVVTAAAFTYVANNYDGNICKKISFLPSEVIFSLPVVLPTYELLGEWGTEFIAQVDSFIEAGAYERVTSNYGLSNENENINDVRFLKGGGAKGGVGGGVSGGTNSDSSEATNVACKSEETDLDIFQLSVQNLLMPILLVIVSTSFALFWHLYNKHNKDLYEKIGPGLDDFDGSLLRKQINEKSVMQLFEELKQLDVPLKAIENAAIALPDKTYLVELLFIEICSIDQRDTMTMSSLSIFELYEIILYCKQMETNETSKYETSTYFNQIALERKLDSEENPKKKLLEFIMEHAGCRRTAIYCAKIKAECTDSFLISDCLFRMNKGNSERMSSSNEIRLEFGVVSHAIDKVRERRLVQLNSYRSLGSSQDLS